MTYPWRPPTPQQVHQPPFHQGVHPAGPPGHQLAEFTDRLLARLIDGAVLGGVGLLIAVPALLATFSLMVEAADSPDPEVWPILLGMLAVGGGIMLLTLLAGYVYEVEMTFRTGQTIGKRAMKIKVVQLDGAPIDRGIATRRWLASNVAATVVPAYSWIDGLWQLWDQPLRQCLHDKFARTVVVTSTPAKGLV